MLVQFEVENFRSIRKKQTLSLQATSSEDKLATHTFSVPGDTDRLLKAAMIVGANASGKSNLLLALREMDWMVGNSANRLQRGSSIPTEPFALTQEGRESPSSFEVVFYQEGIRYQYGFEVTKERVVAEWLYTFPKNYPREWIKRSYNPDLDKDEIKISSSIKGHKVIRDSTRQNALVLSTGALLNNKEFSIVFDWFFKRLDYKKLDLNEASATLYSLENKSRKPVILAMLKEADMGIVDVESEWIEVSGSDALFSTMKRGSFLLPSEIGSGDSEQNYTIVNTKFTHKGSDDAGKIEFGEESAGTQKFFKLIAPVLDALSFGKILIVDELNTSLHPKLVREILRLFLNDEVNKQGAQLLFSSHDPSTMSTLRRDQIWFTEKNKRGETEITPLSDYHPRKNEALVKRYLRGSYGAVPDIDIYEEAINVLVDDEASDVLVDYNE